MNILPRHLQNRKSKTSRKRASRNPRKQRVGITVADHRHDRHLPTRNRLGNARRRNVVVRRRFVAVLRRVIERAVARLRAEESPVLHHRVDQEISKWIRDVADRRPKMRRGAVVSNRRGLQLSCRKGESGLVQQNVRFKNARNVHLRKQTSRHRQHVAKIVKMNHRHQGHHLRQR